FDFTLHDIDDSDTFLNDACLDFGGLTVADAATRAKTRASIAIAADIRPVSAAQPPATIQVNQLVRVQAHGTTVGGETGGGNINGDIIADGAGTLFGGGDNAIG